MSETPALNTDRVLWQTAEGEFPSLAVYLTESGGIGFAVSGWVMVRSREEWIRLISQPSLASQPGEMVSVPVAPTERMLKAAQFANNVDEAWTLMLASRPASPTPETSPPTVDKTSLSTVTSAEPSPRGDNAGRPPAPPATAPEAKPVAWRVKDFADGWITTANEAVAKDCAQAGHRIEPLYDQSALTTHAAAAVAAERARIAGEIRAKIEAAKTCSANGIFVTSGWSGYETACRETLAIVERDHD